MIDQEEFHNTAPAFLDQRRAGAYPHSFSDILCTTNLRARHPIDHRFAICTQLELSVRPHAWQAHFDQAHPAIPRRAQFRVITVARNVNSDLRACLNHPSASGELMPDPIDLDINEWQRLRHDVFSYSC